MSQFSEDEAVVEGTEEFLPPASADVQEDTDATDLPEEEVTGKVIPEGDTEVEAPLEDKIEKPAADEVDYKALAEERTADLQRVTAEYLNYKKRVDRDRGLAKQSGVERVMTDLLPVLDAIELAKQHDDIADGGRMIIEELKKVTSKHGLVAYGEVGEPFDPVKHDALMQQPLDEPVEVVTVSQVIQPGYQLDGRVIRPARVAVANP